MDIGPAEGIIPRALSNLGFDVSVLEHLLCIIGKDKAQYYSDLNFSECVLQIEPFPYHDDIFDVVISFGVIEHIEPFLERNLPSNGPPGKRS